jgi:hypothetical protein
MTRAPIRRPVAGFARLVAAGNLFPGKANTPRPVLQSIAGNGSTI